MDHQAAERLLVDIEARIDVNRYWLNGIQIWPILRRDLWGELLKMDDIPQLYNTDDNYFKTFIANNKHQENSALAEPWMRDYEKAKLSEYLDKADLFVQVSYLPDTRALR